MRLRRVDSARERPAAFDRGLLGCSYGAGRVTHSSGGTITSRVLCAISTQRYVSPTTATQRHRSLARPAPVSHRDRTRSSARLSGSHRAPRRGAQIVDRTELTPASIVVAARKPSRYPSDQVAIAEFER